ncbi:MAG TPA: 3-phosphoshikimate 1-carboxyvinyltransferase [Gemmatimonadaceae bacterium]|nr:3-phosphoshikimate 1-carboxyvinyltransferase [Gemmatimonadaceae bacterium]
MIVAGRLRVPGDKSISHRALMLAALGDGPSRITRILESADVHSTASVLRRLGAEIPALTPDITVQGVGLRGLRAPTEPLDCGNSGTTTRLMAGIVAALPVTAQFVGDASLSRRPMRRVAKPLTAMGARFDLPPHGGLPMTIHGGALKDLDWQSEVASAQVKSAILLAGVVGGVRVTIEEPAPTRDHTERMLGARGVDVVRRGTRIELAPAHRCIAPADTVVPGDPSSAAFFAALAAMADTGELTLDDVCVNETRTGFLDTLRRMGAEVDFHRNQLSGGEWISPVVVRPGTLRGVRVGGEIVPSMIDELPLLACIATRAEGETVITGAAELRVKESDRIAAVVSNLRAVGADASELDDGMRIIGSRGPLRGSIQTYADHRLAMSFGILGALPGNEIRIDDRDCVAVSYPSFWSDLDAITRP